MLPRKINFTQMEKYGMHTEKTYRQTFCTVIDWFYANLYLLKQVSKPTDRLAIAIDPSYISKAGKHTTLAGKFWSGCASSAKWGLEILGIAAINIDLHDSFALKAVQTPDIKTLSKAGITLYQWYADVIVTLKTQLLHVSKYIVADAAFSKDTFISEIMEHGFHLVSRLRDDCRIQYIYNGPGEKRRGKPRQYAGFVDKKHLDTFLSLAFNASLFALNAAKVLHRLRYASANKQVLCIQLAAVFRYKSDRNISMSAFKSLMVNQYLCKRIFSLSGFRPNLKFINQFNQALVEFQLDAC